MEECEKKINILNEALKMKSNQLVGHLKWEKKEQKMWKYYCKNKFAKQFLSTND